MKDFIDPSIYRKNNIINKNLRHNNDFPIFSIVEFNIYGNCNRNCDFCPISDKTIFTRKKEGITVELFQKIMNDLKNFDYRGKILFSAFSEPLLHPEITILLGIARSALPEARLEIVSNGDLLKKDEQMLPALFKAGLDTLSISLYDGPEQNIFFTNLKAKYCLTDDHVILRRRYFEDGNFGMTISNRGGIIDSNKFRDSQEEKIVSLPLKRICNYPFYQILVNYNGDILLCPHDWSGKMVFGNASNDSILDIWSGERMEEVRKKLIISNRDFFPCDFCDVKGDLLGKENVMLWKKIQKNGR